MKPRLVMHYGRRSVEVDIDLNKVDLTRPIAQRSVAQKLDRTLRELKLPRGLVKPGSSDPGRLPRPGVFDLQRELGHWPTAQEYRDAEPFSGS